MASKFGRLDVPPRKQDDSIKYQWKGYKEGDSIELHGVAGKFISNVANSIVIEVAPGERKAVAIKEAKKPKRKARR